jgi:hypothetical protein
MALMWFSVSEDYFALTFFAQPIRLMLGVAIGGAVFGLLLWEMNEFRYRASLRNQGGDGKAK